MLIPEYTRVQGQRQSQSTATKDGATGHQRKEIVCMYKNSFTAQAGLTNDTIPLAQKLDKLLKILDPLDCSWKHRETSSTRQSDTCLWFPATDAYRSWREGKDTFLWLQGKGVSFDGSNGSVTDTNVTTAGAGKSVLACVHVICYWGRVADYASSSSVINDLHDTKNDGEILVYFYCDFRTKRSTSALEVMRSLLALLTESLCRIITDPEALLDELLKGADSRVHPFYNVKALAHYLSKVVQLCPRKPLVVVDALDECREVETLIDGLLTFGGDVQMFVTTRPLQNIIRMLSHLPYISMDEKTNELSADILLHVTREVDSRSRLRTFDRTLKEEIRFKLCAKADGM